MSVFEQACYGEYFCLNHVKGIRMGAGYCLEDFVLRVSVVFFGGILRVMMRYDLIKEHM